MARPAATALSDHWQCRPARASLPGRASRAQSINSALATALSGPVFVTFKMTFPLTAQTR